MTWAVAMDLPEPLAIQLLYVQIPGGGGDSHMKQTGTLVGNFEFNP